MKLLILFSFLLLDIATFTFFILFVTAVSIADLQQSVFKLLFNCDQLGLSRLNDRNHTAVHFMTLASIIFTEDFVKIKEV